MFYFLTQQLSEGLRFKNSTPLSYHLWTSVLSLFTVCMQRCLFPCMWMNLELVSTRDKLNPGALTPGSLQRSPCLPTTSQRGCKVLIQCPAADLHSLSSQQQQECPHCPSPSAADLFLQRLQVLLETAGSGVQGQLKNRAILQERGSVAGECQQCFGHSDWQCVRLMRSVWIMNEPADLPHNSLSSMKPNTNTKAQSLQGFTGANNWPHIQPHVSSSLSFIIKFATFKLGFATTSVVLADCFHKENMHAFHAWAWRIWTFSYILQATIISETWCCNHLQICM